MRERKTKRGDKLYFYPYGFGDSVEVEVVEVQIPFHPKLQGHIKFKVLSHRFGEMHSLKRGAEGCELTKNFLKWSRPADGKLLFHEWWVSRGCKIVDNKGFHVGINRRRLAEMVLSEAPLISNFKIELEGLDSFMLLYQDKLKEGAV